MKRITTYAADVDRLETWVKYRQGLCSDCIGSCCTMPVEVQMSDLIRLGLADEFEREEPLKNIAKRLQKEKIISHFNHKSGRFTLSQRSNNDCLYLDTKTRLCTVYTQRPDTCRNHPQIGPKPGYCAYATKPAA
jgi:Fe-S-cluster containining protein